MQYKRDHTFVHTIFLLLNIVQRLLLIRVTRVYIEHQIISQYKMPGGEGTYKGT
jgi:hypothetical protein